MGHPLNFNVEITISPFIFESIDLQYLIEFFSSYKSSNLKQNNIFNLKKKKFCGSELLNSLRIGSIISSNGSYLIRFTIGFLH